MNELHVLDRTGDTKTIWDPENRDETKAAEDTFNTLKKKGFLIYAVEGDGSKGRAMRDFDRTAGKLIAIPRQAGG